MLLFALALLAGCAVPLFWHVAPDYALVILLLTFSGCVGLSRTVCARSPLLFVSGIAIGICLGAFSVDHRQAVWLEKSLVGHDLTIGGCIASLPEPTGQGWRFDFSYHDAHSGKTRKVRLGWYTDGPPPRAGQFYRYVVRLKPPVGYVNPGSLDYERWMFQRGYAGSGYVKRQMLSTERAACEQYRLLRIRRDLLEGLRSETEMLPSGPLIQALALGYRGAISSDQWTILRNTGTAHLVAISGLHVGLVSGLVFLLTRRIALWVSQTGVGVNPEKAAAVISVLAALCYAALSGFALPARRAAIMVTIYAGAFLFRRQIRFSRLIGAALVVILLVEPLSVIDTGFWLSFGAVTLIFVAGVGRHRSGGQARALIWLQPRLFLLMIPLTLLFFGQVGMGAPVANLVAIPIVGSIVVPAILLATLLIQTGTAGAGLLMQLADFLLQALWAGFDLLGQTDTFIYVPSRTDIGMLAMLLLGLCLVLMPRSFRLTLPAVALLFPFAFAGVERPAAGAVRFTLLDVGQGLAGVIETQHHTILYDAGPRYRSGASTGERVIVPYLRQRATDKIDLLIISHGDIDHRGGARSILEAFPVTERVSGEPARLDIPDVGQCAWPMTWLFDSVKFSLLSPADPVTNEKSNNRSCVLMIEAAAGGRILMTGDIETRIESELLKRVGSDALSADILVAPHHGSETSSSGAFIKAVNPGWVLFPAGRFNHWDFPRSTVTSRYREEGRVLLGTGTCGAISFELGKEISTPVYARSQWRAWRPSADCRFGSRNK